MCFNVILLLLLLLFYLELVHSWMSGQIPTVLGSTWQKDGGGKGGRAERGRKREGKGGGGSTLPSVASSPPFLPFFGFSASLSHLESHVMC